MMCCCDGGQWENGLFVVTKCMPAALDLGHCGEDELTFDQTYCCGGKND